MLPTGVTALTAHSCRHGNRDEHSYLCPYIHWLCFPDKLPFSHCISSHLSPSLSCSVFLSFCFYVPFYVTYDAQQGTGGLKIYPEGFRVIAVVIALMRIAGRPIYVYLRMAWAFKSPLDFVLSACVFVWFSNGFLIGESTTKAGAS